MNHGLGHGRAVNTTLSASVGFYLTNALPAQRVRACRQQFDPDLCQ